MTGTSSNDECPQETAKLDLFTVRPFENGPAPAFLARFAVTANASLVNALIAVSSAIISQARL